MSVNGLLEILRDIARRSHRNEEKSSVLSIEARKWYETEQYTCLCKRAVQSSPRWASSRSKRISLHRFSAVNGIIITAKL